MAAIYQADLWCDDCADAIREQVQARGHAPADPDDEHTYDSDEYPKHAGDDDESDCPQHCGAGETCLNAIELPSGRKVGLLFGSLTSDGVDYVREHAFDPSGEVVDLWVRHFSDGGYDLGLTKCSHCSGFVDVA
jgi:hypothetical protein